MLDPDRAEGEALARVCVEKLGGYLRDEGGDQNRESARSSCQVPRTHPSVRFIALLAMAKITPTHPQMVAEYQEEIMQSLDDSDVSIRMRALELVTSMVSVMTMTMQQGHLTDRYDRSIATACSLLLTSFSPTLRQPNRNRQISLRLRHH